MNSKSAAFLACAAALAGCAEYLEDGYAPYRSDAPNPIALTMPENAPFMSQQFYVPADGDANPHNGFDLWGERGHPILAAAPGTVVSSYYEPAYGNRVTINHGTDESGRVVETHYRHLNARSVAAGQAVARGERIATMGSSGVTGLLVHLHFEVRRGAPGTAPEPEDPNLYWMDGVGQFTCFDPAADYPDLPFRITSPAACD